MTGSGDRPDDAHPEGARPDEAALAGIAALLATKRTELEAELSELTRVEVDRGDITFGKRVGDGTSVAVERLAQVAAHDRLQEMLADVRHAEANLAAGRYGVCDGCGRLIAADRLEALPWATRCIDCAGSR
jgi:DnaK suppressor protein